MPSYMYALWELTLRGRAGDAAGTRPTARSVLTAAGCRGRLPEGEAQRLRAGDPVALRSRPDEVVVKKWCVIVAFGFAASPR